MKIYNTILGPYVEKQGQYFSFCEFRFDTLLNQPNLYMFLYETIQYKKPDTKFKPDNTLLPPIVSQEVWASGVT